MFDELETRRGSVVPLDPQPHLNRSVAKQTRRDLDNVRANALVAEMVEEGRGLIASTALQIATMLASQEESARQVAPCGAARYKAIADAHAIGAAQAVSRWPRWIN
jgi:hypothetical protein